MKNFVSKLSVIFLIVLCCFSSNFNKVVFPFNYKIESQVYADTRLDMRDEIYNQLIDEIGENYFIENIDIKYISQEYIEDLEYNSRENIYFGYTESELKKQFNNSSYIFSYDDKTNSTVVNKLVEYDDTYEKILKNIATGGGVILVSATVSSLSGGAAPAISVIFASSAEIGTGTAVSSAMISGVITGIVEGVKTKNPSKSLKKAALSASENFKWGAISGALIGGSSAAISLKGATLKGLTMNEAAIIQKNSEYPLSVIKNLKSMEEYELYKKYKLVAIEIDEKTALVQKIDLKTKSKLGGRTVTNLERMQKGYAPVDSKGYVYELHHVGQEKKSPLAILTKGQHRSRENYNILHVFGKKGVHNKKEGISSSDWSKQKKQFWKDYANKFGDN
ncbi:HNH/ENDO VII family nuclease [Streptococcus pluranimalium]|uniref:HNH/ENDO VII family nuclease n=1 Tax=Streptococcus hyovaginalis TaxID=149015 RepID=UPI0014787AA4|nr:HNH/ENDO VII family nuclease [Streptococcus hyovaginalis]